MSKKRMGLLVEEGTENLVSPSAQGLLGGEQTGGSAWLVEGGMAIPGITDNRGIRASLVSGSGGYRIRYVPASVEGVGNLSCWVYNPTQNNVRMTIYRLRPGSFYFNVAPGQVLYVDETGEMEEGTDKYFQINNDLIFYGLQVEGKPYPTTFTPGTRAPSLTKLPLTTPLPEEFGIGLSARMLHESAVKDRTFWQAGPYKLHYDANDQKIKMQLGGVVAAVEAEWGVDSIIGVYGGQRDRLFLQAKVDGEMTGLIRVTGDGVIGVDEIIIGSNSEGETGEPSGHVNGVIADFAYHFTPEKIDPASYLAKVPDGGGTE